MHYDNRMNSWVDECVGPEIHGYEESWYHKPKIIIAIEESVIIKNLFENRSNYPYIIGHVDNVVEVPRLNLMIQWWRKICL